MGGQSTAATTVKEADGKWRLADTVNTPMGEVTDISVYDKGL